MTPPASARRLLPTLLAGVLVAACTATAAVPAPASIIPASPAATTAIVLPSPSLAPRAGPHAPEHGRRVLHRPRRSIPRPGCRRRRRSTVGALQRPSPSPTPRRPRRPSTRPLAWPEGPFEMDLYRKRDFVTEATKWYCVPAAMLTMINIMSKGAEHSKATQKVLYQLARSLSTKTLVGKGAEPIGWARGLEQLGYGGFEVGVHGSRRAAIRAAAKAIRLTGRPAGLLVWRGAHSWVMSGFRATADPAVTDDFTVTARLHPGRLVPLRQLDLGQVASARLPRARGRAQGGLPQVAPTDPTLPGHGRPVRDHPARRPTRSSPDRPAPRMSSRRRPACPMCGHGSFRQERGQIDSGSWGVTAHRSPAAHLRTMRVRARLLRGQHHLRLRLTGLTPFATLGLYSAPNRRRAMNGTSTRRSLGRESRRLVEAGARTMANGPGSLRTERPRRCARSATTRRQ